MDLKMNESNVQLFSQSHSSQFFEIKADAIKVECKNGLYKIYLGNQLMVPIAAPTIKVFFGCSFWQSLACLHLVISRKMSSFQLSVLFFPSVNKSISISIESSIDYQPVLCAKIFFFLKQIQIIGLGLSSPTYIHFFALCNLLADDTQKKLTIASTIPISIAAGNVISDLFVACCILINMLSSLVYIHLF